MKDDTTKRVDDAIAAGADRAEIKRLAALSRMQYERERKSAAERLGMRASALDRLVEAARKEQSAPDQGSAIVVEDVQPWSKPVDGASLLDEMAGAMASHIAMTNTEADTIALWCVYGHAYELFPVAPRLGIRAATSECGKTEALRRIKRFVNRPLECDGLTAPVFFRVIDASKPTFLLDELDNMLPEDKSAMLGAMNSGYSRKGKQLRCVGDENEVRAFRTFAPFVYAMVGKPTNTFDSRTIAIELRRATPEKARALLSLEDEDDEDKRLSDMGRKAARWVADHLDALAKIRSDMGELVNRPAMNWRPLFAVADLAGGDWPARVRKAAAAAVRVRGDQDIKAELIIDTKSVMDENRAVEEWPSAMLAEHLARLEGRPWAEFGKAQKPITQNAIARLLRPFGIAPTRIGPEGGQARGYCRWQFREVFDAYAALPPSHNHQGVKNAMDIEQVGNSQPSSAGRGLTVEKSQKPAALLSSRHFDGCKRGVAPNTANGGGGVPEQGCYGQLERQQVEAAQQAADGAPEGGKADDGLDVPEFLRHTPAACTVCRQSEPPPNQVVVDGLNVWLHPGCEAAQLAGLADDSSRTPLQPAPAEPPAATNGASAQRREELMAYVASVIEEQLKQLDQGVPVPVQPAPPGRCLRVTGGERNSARETWRHCVALRPNSKSKSTRAAHGQRRHLPPSPNDRAPEARRHDRRPHRNNPEAAAWERAAQERLIRNGR